ncbi:hypothetical protein [uncultured Ruminococcus sp.]|nr:hypothetical protein [uncultured Ruminococcus sp.]
MKICIFSSSTRQCSTYKYAVMAYELHITRADFRFRDEAPVTY